MESFASPFNELDPFARRLLEAIPDALLAVNAHGQIVLFNQQTLELFGFDEASQLLNQPLELLLPERFHTQHRQYVRSYFAAPHLRKMSPNFEVLAQHQAGHDFQVEISLNPFFMEPEVYTLAIIRDVSERAELLKKLHYFAMHDALTGLYNRAFFEEECARIEQGRHFPVSVLALDLDGLKAVNDKLGHAVGDELFKRTSAVLRQTFRADDILARIGGDEFAILLPDTSAPVLERQCLRLEQVLAEHNQDQIVPLRFSYGGATAREQSSLMACYREADAVMYRQKRQRKQALDPRSLLL